MITADEESERLTNIIIRWNENDKLAEQQLYHLRIKNFKNLPVMSGKTLLARYLKIHFLIFHVIQHLLFMRLLLKLTKAEISLLSQLKNFIQYSQR